MINISDTSYERLAFIVFFKGQLSQALSVSPKMRKMEDLLPQNSIRRCYEGVHAVLLVRMPDNVSSWI